MKLATSISRKTRNYPTIIQSNKIQNLQSNGKNFSSLILHGERIGRKSLDANSAFEEYYQAKVLPEIKYPSKWKKKQGGIPTSQLLEYLDRIKSPQIEQKVDKMHELARSPKSKTRFPKSDLLSPTHQHMRSYSSFGNATKFQSNKERSKWKLKGIMKSTGNRSQRIFRTLPLHPNNKQTLASNKIHQNSAIEDIYINNGRLTEENKLYFKKKMSDFYLAKVGFEGGLTLDPKNRIKKRQILQKQKAELIDGMEEILSSTPDTYELRTFSPSNMQNKNDFTEASINALAPSPNRTARPSMFMLREVEEGYDMKKKMQEKYLGSPFFIKKGGNTLKGTKVIANCIGSFFGIKNIYSNYSYNTIENISNNNVSNTVRLGVHTRNKL